MALPARAVDQRLEPGGDPVACLVGALLPEVGMVDDVGQARGLRTGAAGPAPDSSSAWPRGSATIDLDDIPAVEAVAFAAYEDGLRSAGWRGDRRLIRVGYAAAVALRLGICMPGWAALMLGPEQVLDSERLFRRPAEAILATWIALTDIWLDLADEARAGSRPFRAATDGEPAVGDGV